MYLKKNPQQSIYVEVWIPKNLSGCYWYLVSQYLQCFITANFLFIFFLCYFLSMLGSAVPLLPVPLCSRSLCSFIFYVLFSSFHFCSPSFSVLQFSARFPEQAWSRLFGFCSTHLIDWIWPCCIRLLNLINSTTLLTQCGIRMQQSMHKPFL